MEWTDSTTSCDILKRTIFCRFFHRHGDFSATTVVHTDAFRNTWSVTKCHACHTKRHHNFLRHLEKETFLQLPPKTLRSQRKATTSCDTLKQICFCSFPHKHRGARGKPEPQHDTRGSLKTSMSCETSSNFVRPNLTL